MGYDQWEAMSCHLLRFELATNACNKYCTSKDNLATERTESRFKNKPTASWKAEAHSAVTVPSTDSLPYDALHRILFSLLLSSLSLQFLLTQLEGDDDDTKVD